MRQASRILATRVGETYTVGKLLETFASWYASRDADLVRNEGELKALRAVLYAANTTKVNEEAARAASTLAADQSDVFDRRRRE